jgi:hypothetical protein
MTVGLQVHANTVIHYASVHNILVWKNKYPIILSPWTLALISYRVSTAKQYIAEECCLLGFYAM